MNKELKVNFAFSGISVSDSIISNTESIIFLIENRNLTNTQ